LEKYIQIAKSTLNDVKEKSDYHRAEFVLKLKHNELGESATDTHNEIRNILSTITSVLSKIQHRLDEELEFVGYRTKSDYQEKLDNFIEEPNSIPRGNVGRITFKMSKKETLMLLYVMEQKGLLEFESEEQRKKFVEANLSYTEMRNNDNKGKSFEMTGVNSEFSNLKAGHLSVSNNKLLEKVLSNLEGTIYKFKF